MKTKKYIIIVFLTLVTMNTIVSATPIADLDYQEETMTYITGDVNLVFDNVNYNGSSADLTMLRIGYDNNTNISFYNIRSNTLTINPGFENNTKTYTYIDSGDLYTVTVDYSSILVPMDPETQIELLESEIENLTLSISNLTSLWENLTKTLEQEQNLNINLSFEIAIINNKLQENNTQLVLANEMVEYLNNIVDPLNTEIDMQNNTITNLTIKKEGLQNDLEDAETLIFQKDKGLNDLINPWSLGYTTYKDTGFLKQAEGNLYINYASLLIGVFATVFIGGTYLYKTEKINSPFLNNLFSKVTKKEHKELKARKNSIDMKLENLGKQKLKKLKEKSQQETKIPEEKNSDTADFFNNIDKEPNKARYKHDDVIKQIDNLFMYQ